MRRQLLGVVIVSLGLGWLIAPASAGPSGSSRAEGEVAAPRTTVAGRHTGDRPSVDPRVSAAIGRARVVDALVVLDGSTTLASAREISHPSSRALLSTTIPAYRNLKDGLARRLPTLNVLRDYRTLPILGVRIGSKAELARLVADPAVVGIGADRRDTVSLTESLPLIGQPAAAAAGHTGAGTAVAVLDTGADYTRSAFGSCSAPGVPGCAIVVAQDFAPDDGLLDDPVAGFHGTNVSGIVAGVAPGTKILALDVFDGLGSSTSTQISAIDFVLANQAAFNIRAVNMSLGSTNSYQVSKCGDPSDPRVAAFANLRAAGVLPVVAAGNDAFSADAFHIGIAKPACIPGAVSVGAVYDSNIGGRVWGNGQNACTDATTAADKITCFSQTAHFLTVLAPGALITAAGATQGGTSQAAPHVAGAVAVLAGANAAAAPAAIQTAIGSSGPLIDDPLIGMSFHRLDLPAAVATLVGTPVPDGCTISGDDQADVLEGTAGDDVICGGGGDDLIILGQGSDRVVGGDGFDQVSLEDATGGGTIDLRAGTASAPGIAATLEEIEGVVGSPFDDTLIGDSDDNEFLGLGGDDAIVGAGGVDVARYDLATKRIRADLTIGEVLGEGSDTLAGIEGVVGGPLSDRLIGNGRGNVFSGLAGRDLLQGLGKADTLFGGPGRDELLGGGGVDDLRGGPGADVCDVGPGGGTVSSC